jgi:pimeloyl-ACP methyl ester carboxylesterase
LSTVACVGVAGSISRAMKAVVMASFALLTASPCAAQDEEVRTVATRPDVTESFLLIRPATSPVASVVLFPGGEGVAHVDRLRTEGDGQSNFLVRNRRRFAEAGFLVAVVDVPSDHAAGYGRFRGSKEHARDVAAVLAESRREAPVPVWAIGTSMGTVSAVNAAVRLRDAPTVSC